jgi:Flp pilus assembly protein TadD
MSAPHPANRKRLELAMHHHLAGRLREAVAIYEDLLQAAPNDADLLQRLGVALAQLGRPAEGVRLLSASLELKPDRPTVLVNLARALLAARAPPHLPLWAAPRRRWPTSVRRSD